MSQFLDVAQVIVLTAEVYGGYARPRRALVDQLAILDDGVAMSNVIFEKAVCVDVASIEEFELAIAMALEGGIPVECRALI